MSYDSGKSVPETCRPALNSNGHGHNGSLVTVEATLPVPARSCFIAGSPRGWS